VRILVLSDLYPPVALGGYERDCAALVEGLRGAGHDVLVLTSDRDAAGAPQVPHVRREVPWLPEDRVRRTLTAAAASARAVAVTERALDDLRPDVVVVFNLLGVPQATMLVALRRGLPVVLRLAESYFAGQLMAADPFLQHLDRGGHSWRRPWSAVARAVNRTPALRLAPRAPARVSVAWASHDLRRRAALPAHLGVRQESVIHPLSLQAEDFGLLRRAPFTDPTLLYLGRLTEDKGAEIAYRALSELRRRGVPARLVLAGPADPRTGLALDSLAAALGVAEDVKRVGPLDAAAIAPLLQGAHAMLVPSLVPDVFPLVIVEAARARVPVVAADIGGIPEAVRDEEHALLFPPGDVTACATALARVLADPEEAVARAERAFQHMSRLTPGRYLAQWEELLAGAVSDR
jgi:glycosyltransferase involved in cell wall biosynthesis